jgi:hypothetical protein
LKRRDRRVHRGRSGEIDPSTTHSRSEDARPVSPLRSFCFCDHSDGGIWAWRAELPRGRGGDETFGDERPRGSSALQRSCEKQWNHGSEIAVGTPGPSSSPSGEAVDIDPSTTHSRSEDARPVVLCDLSVFAATPMAELGRGGPSSGEAAGVTRRLATSGLAELGPPANLRKAVESRIKNRS